MKHQKVSNQLAGRQKQIEDLSAENGRLILELKALQARVASTNKQEPDYPQPLIDLFDQAKPIEWYNNMGALLDALIIMMHHNEDYYFGDLLQYTRSLEKFFLAISAYGNFGRYCHE